jgi:Holliday junction resolvase RusA-like endonuclease
MGQPHRAKPDRDNIDKAILDALFPDDSVVAEGYLCKLWDDGKGARIEIEMED